MASGVRAARPLTQDKSVDHILKTPGFTNAERRAMLGETAAKLLGIKAF
jgi:hypothetical protein